MSKHTYNLDKCSNCGQIVAIDQHGLVKCNNCYSTWIIDMKKKQKKLPLTDYIKQGRHKTRGDHGYFIKEVNKA